ncbi:uncharacterized protein LOC118748411 [Rhagoletis pomonella]|uniref:uncharacterized protein LOC118748411 n=1 Tax=Rhagoletis pomonella TaxID=28610 RepID=UPI0017822EEB|nr:uncharacterized protein LOC118748411 [Rhagoletis pomonella]
MCICVLMSGRVFARSVIFLKDIEAIRSAFDAKFKELFAQFDNFKSEIKSELQAINVMDNNNASCPQMLVDEVNSLKSAFACSSDVLAGNVNNGKSLSTVASVTPAPAAVSPLHKRIDTQSKDNNIVKCLQVLVDEVNSIKSAIACSANTSAGIVINSNSFPTVAPESSSAVSPSHMLFRTNDVSAVSTVVSTRSSLTANKGFVTNSKPTIGAAVESDAAAQSSAVIDVDESLPVNCVQTDVVNAELEAADAVNATDTGVSASPSPTPWRTVENKRRRQSRKPVRVVGSNDCSDLGVATPFKWLHLSSFLPTVSCDNIIEYVGNHTGIDKRRISCYKLVKKESNLESLTHVNFKLGVCAHNFDNLLRPELWPANVSVRPFRFFQKLPQQMQLK